jgi:hypothetical protein
MDTCAYIIRLLTCLLLLLLLLLLHRSRTRLHQQPFPVHGHL